MHHHHHHHLAARPQAEEEKLVNKLQRHLALLQQNLSLVENHLVAKGLSLEALGLKSTIQSG